ncbi:hypothetical protein RhiJN_10330 [Ceratobasidium sp. AG-Ba]|nr:hypothetical protein RhiJN_10330 [Ceratobasidium sp. AG-Ba]
MADDDETRPDYFLDNNLPPIVTGRLRDFNHKFRELADLSFLRQDQFGPHTKFALTGRYSVSEDQTEQMKINIDDVQTQPFRLSVSSDVDSVIGIICKGEDFPIKPDHSLFYSILNNSEFAHKLSNHLPPYEYTSPTGVRTLLDYHHIPNTLVGHLGGANVQKIEVRVYFPRMALTRQARDGNKVSKDLMIQFYKLAARPSITCISALTEHEWPDTYLGEEFRARRANGTIVHSTRTIPGELATRFFDGIHARCDAEPTLEQARDFFIQFTVQGSKGGTKHNIPGPIPGFEFPSLGEEDPPIEDLPPSLLEFKASRLKALMKAMSPLNPLMIQDDSYWWADVAVTIKSKDAGQSVLVKQHMHHWIIGEMTGLDVSSITERMNRASGGYHSDSFVQLNSTAGLRMTLSGGSMGPLDTAYVQAYHSGDKDLCALKDGLHHAKHVEPARLFKDHPGADQHHFEPLEQLFIDARDENRSINVKLESRVPFNQVDKALRVLNMDRLAECLTTCRSKDIWDFKVTRLKAIRATLGKMHGYLPSIPRQKLSAFGTLVCALGYMANALCNRPAEGPSFKKLTEVCSVQERRYNVARAIQPLGAFFLVFLADDPCPRLSHARTLDFLTLAHLSGINGATENDVFMELVATIKRTGIKRLAPEDSELPAWGPNGELPGWQA